MNHKTDKTTLQGAASKPLRTRKRFDPHEFWKKMIKGGKAATIELPRGNGKTETRRWLDSWYSGPDQWSKTGVPWYPIPAFERVVDKDSPNFPFS